MSQQAFLSSTYGTTAQVYEDKVRYKSFQLDNSILGKAEKAKLPAAADKKRLRCTAKQRRQQKLSAVPRKCSYDQFIPLNQLWKEYMHSSVLTKPNQREPNQALMARVLMADWHGAEMEGRLAR
jgi:hypothetical protein